MKHVHKYFVLITWTHMGQFSMEVYARNEEQARAIAQSKLSEHERILSIRRCDNESEE